VIDEDLVEKFARIICVAEGVDPDKEGHGMDGLFPKGTKFPLWKARITQAEAVLEQIEKDKDVR